MTRLLGSSNSSGLCNVSSQYLPPLTVPLSCVEVLSHRVCATFSLQRVRRLFCIMENPSSSRYYVSPSVFSRRDIADYTSIIEEYIHHLRSSAFRVLLRWHWWPCDVECAESTLCSCLMPLSESGTELNINLPQSQDTVTFTVRVRCPEAFS